MDQLFKSLESSAVVGAKDVEAISADNLLRMTGDMDLFVRRQDVPVALDALEKHLNTRPDWAHPHWLAKAWADEADKTDGAFVDFIFRSANGLCAVDDDWLDHACPGDVLGRYAPLCPAEGVRSCRRSADWRLGDGA